MKNKQQQNQANINKKRINMKKHLLLLSACMTLTVQISAQEVNGKATRLLSCDYTYDNKMSNQVDHDTYTYTYDANGLPKVAMRGKTRYEYEFDMNDKGCWTKRTIYMAPEGKTRTMTEQTTRLYDEESRLVEEKIFEPQDPNNASSLVLKTLNNFKYDHGTTGYCSQHISYTAENEVSSIKQKLWFEALQSFKTNEWSQEQQGNQRTEIEVDNATNTFISRQYTNAKGTEVQQEAKTTYITLTDNLTLVAENVRYTYKDGALDRVYGYAYDYAFDTATNMVTEKAYDITLVDGEAVTSTTPRSWTKKSLNMYTNVVWTQANGNRYTYDYDVNTGELNTTTTYEWQSNNIVKKTRNGITQYSYYNNEGIEQGYVLYNGDRSYTVRDNRCEGLQDYKDHAVYVTQYNADGTIKKELRLIVNEVDETLYQANIPAKVMIKNGDTWVASGQQSFAYLHESSNTDMYAVTTDTYGRIIDIQGKTVSSDGSIISSAHKNRYSYTYVNDNNVKCVYYTYDNKYDESSKKAIKFYQVNKNDQGREIIYYSDATFSVPQTKLVYDLNTHCLTEYSYEATGWQQDKVKAFTEGHYEGDSEVFSIYTNGADGTIQPVRKWETGYEGSVRWRRYYNWDKDKAKWVGTYGNNTIRTTTQEFTFIEPDAFIDSYDPYHYGKNEAQTVCSDMYSKMNINFEWDNGNECWLMTKEGYDVSDDGLTCNYFCISDEGEMKTVYVRNAAGQLLSYRSTMSIGSDEYINNQTYTYDTDGRVLKLVKETKRPSFESVITYAYHYGDVTLSAVDNLSADVTAKVQVNGRTFSLNGTQLALYDTAGQLVTKAKDAVTAPAAGLYLLKADGKTLKVMVK